jgi:RimJ/RimL family protein N-acetyltransferase
VISELETKRLLLSPLRLSDAPAAQRLFPHWEIVQYLANRVPWPYPEDGALTYYRDIALPAMARGEEWHWGIRLKGGPDHIIGAINLTRTQPDHRGFWLALPWQGQGLMTEATAAVNDYWFDVLGFPVLRTSKAVVNQPSRRISQKNGMRLLGTEERAYVSGKLMAEMWEITAEEWRALRKK